MSGGVRGQERRVMLRSREARKVEEMLDAALQGNFRESDYDESELSRVETKWKRFLSTSALSKEQLEREKENVKSLVSDISHQTKTPVANIRLYTELLKERLCGEENTPERQQEIRMAEEISRQAEKLEFLIQSLTKMSRLESNILAVQPEEQGLKKLLEESIGDVTPKAEKKQIQIINNCVDNITAFYDFKWTKEAVCNVLDNAVKYSPRGGKVILSVTEYELYAAVSVRDEGIGIPEEDTARIFGRFYRAESVQQEDGVGIGLYLTREILRKQNGYIKVKSAPGKGSEFFLYLQRGRM
jgi:two-component system sensor histidine kinase SenX3